jgi:hypothetical protein
MANVRSIHALILAGVASAIVGAVALSQPALAQADPGVRGGPPGAGGPLPNLVAGGTGFFTAAQSFFTQVFSVSGTLNDGGPIGAPNGGPGLGPRYNLNQCSGCHVQPAIGGTSPSTNPQVAVATLEGAHNVVPPFITLHGPVREARFVRNPDGTPDGQVHELYVITGRPDAPGCNIAQPNFAAEIAARNVVFRIPTHLRSWARGTRIRPHSANQFCGEFVLEMAVRYLGAFQHERQRWHHHAVWLEGAKQVPADVLGRSLPRGDGRHQRAFSQQT